MGSSAYLLQRLRPCGPTYPRRAAVVHMPGTLLLLTCAGYPVRVRVFKPRAGLMILAGFDRFESDAAVGTVEIAGLRNLKMRHDRAQHARVRAYHRISGLDTLSDRLAELLA